MSKSVPTVERVVVLPRLWRAKDVADATGEDLQRIYILARTGKMPVIRLGRSIRFDPAAVREWLADIVIRVMGSSAATITKKATALSRLATSMLLVNTAMKATPGAAAMYATGANRVTSAANKAGKANAAAGKRVDAFGTSLRGGANALDHFGTLFSRMLRIMSGPISSSLRSSERSASSSRCWWVLLQRWSSGTPS